MALCDAMLPMTKVVCLKLGNCPPGSTSLLAPPPPHFPVTSGLCSSRDGVGPNTRASVVSPMEESELVEVLVMRCWEVGGGSESRDGQTNSGRWQDHNRSSCIL